MKTRKLIILLFAILGFTKITIAQTTAPLEIEFGLRSGLPNAYTYSQIRDAGNYLITTETIWSQPLNCKLKVINKINGSTTYIENLDNVNFDSSFQITESVYVDNQNAYYFGLTIIQDSFNSEIRIYKLNSSGLLTVISSSLNTEANTIKKLYVKENYLFSIYKNKIIKINISSFVQIQEIPLNTLINEGTIYEIGNDEFILHKYVVNSNNNYDVFLSKFNINGQVLWEKTIAGSGNEFVANLICLNGYTYICGTTNSSDGNFEGFEDWSLPESTKTGWISKLDSNGTLLWIKGFGGMEGAGGFQSLLIKDNYIFASGNCRSYYNYYSSSQDLYNNNIKTVKLDLNGNLIWEKKYGGFNNQEFSSFGIVNNQLVYTTNLWRYVLGSSIFSGSFVYCQGDVTAETSGKFNNPLNFENPNQKDIWIFATDLDGVIQWNQLYGGESNDFATSTIYNPQDLYIAASTQSSGYDVGDPIGYSDSWIFKLFANSSANSSSNCNDSPTALPQTICANATVSNLVATGTDLHWYANATVRAALDNFAILTSGTYYVSQTIGNCESPRTPVAVTVTPQISPTFTPITSTCLGATMIPLPTTSNNGITGTWSPAINNNVTTTYTFTPNAGQCAATTSQTITITTPKVTSAISFVAPPITVAALPNVTIGTQIWTNKNLEVSTYRDGTPIPQVTDPTAWANLTTGAWCYYNNDPANGEVYGKLYNWYASAGIYDAASLNDTTLRKQFAPVGWHVPSDAEWTVLTDFLGGENVAGGKMKSTSILLWQSPNGDATNESGFTGLPGGYRHDYDGTYGNIGYDGLWWSSSEYGSGASWPRTLFYNNGVVYMNFAIKKSGLSVRLIKD